MKNKIYSVKRPIKRSRILTPLNSYGRKLCPREVFNKGIKIPGLDPDMWRLDFQGKMIKFTERDSRGPFGWAIDHNIPRSCGGSDSIVNLFPLNWKDNIRFSNKLTEEKKTYNRREHFYQILIHKGENAQKIQKKNLEVGSVIQARQSPIVKLWRHATVISANKSKDCVEIHWVDGNYNETLVYDDRLFEI